MAKLTEDISEVHSIMTKNIQDVLNHGERLDSKLTSALCFDSLHTCRYLARISSWNACELFFLLHLQVSAQMSDVNLGHHHDYAPCDHDYCMHNISVNMTCRRYTMQVMVHSIEIRAYFQE